MKKTTIVLFLGIITTLSLSFFHKTDPSLNISYSLNYKGDSWQKQRTGFLWALSYLGAELPKGSFDGAIEWKDSSNFKIDFGKLGFDGYALNALTVITDSIKETAYYKKYNRIDLGQFIALTIGSSWHYYAITNTPATYQKFLSVRGFKNPTVFLLSKSTVAKHHRVIKYSINPSVLQTTIIAEEGEGDLGNNFSPAFFETIDVMKNGQLHFAVYNAEGNLVSASPLELGSAGKPAKCMWCHEIVFQPLYAKTDSVKNSVGPHAFQQLIEKQNNILSDYRKTLNSDINFNNRQDHTLMELLYISYMEPSLKKLAKEWDVPEKELKAILNQQVTHQHYEFKFMDSLYFRGEIEQHTPCKYISVSKDIREPSVHEPDFIKKRK
jgi:hypothetical protein